MSSFFLLNDISVEQLSRILILSRVLYLSKGKKSVTSSINFLFRFYYYTHLSPTDYATFKHHCEELVKEIEVIEFAGSAPSSLSCLPAFQFNQNTASALITALRLWAEAAPVPWIAKCHKQRQAVIINRINLCPQVKKDKAFTSITRAAEGLIDATGMSRSASKGDNVHYAVHGSYECRPTPSSLANPTLYRLCDYDPEAPLWTAHYGTYPSMGFPITEGRRPSVSSCKQYWARWMRAYRTALHAGRCTVGLEQGDCCSMLAERALSAHPYAWTAQNPFKFDYIGVSNVADVVGMGNLLATTAPFLSVPGRSVLSAQVYHRDIEDNARAFIHHAVGCAVRDLPLVFGLRMVDEEDDSLRGSPLMAFSLLPNIAHLPRASSGRNDQTAIGTSPLNSYTSLVFTATPVTVPAPAVNGADSALRRALLGVMYRCLPDNHRFASAYACTIETFCAILAIGARRGLWASTVTEALVAVPVGPPGEKNAASGRELVAKGHVVAPCIESSMVGTEVGLYRTKLMSVANEMLAEMGGAGPLANDLLICLSTFAATFLHFGIDVRPMKGPSCMTVRLTSGEVVKDILMTPRELSVVGVNLSDPKFKTKLVGPALFSLGPIVEKCPTPAIIAHISTTESDRTKHALNMERLGSIEMHMNRSLSIHGYGLYDLDPAKHLHLQHVFQPSIIKQAVPGEWIHVESSQIMNSVHPVHLPLTDKGADTLFRLPTTVTRPEGPKGNILFKFEVDIPDSLAQIIVDNATPGFEPTTQPGHSAPAGLLAYERAGAVPFNQGAYGDAMDDIYSGNVMLGTQVITSVSFPVPIDPVNIRIQISRKRRFLRVYLSQLPYKVPGPRPTTFALDSSVPEICKEGRDSRLLSVVMNSMMTADRGSEMAKMLKKGNLGDIQYPIFPRIPDLQPLVDLRESLQIIFVTYITENCRVFSFKETDGSKSVVGSLIVHGLHEHGSSLALDVSLFFNAELPRDQVMVLGSTMQRMEPHRTLLCNTKELELLSRVFRMAEGYTSKPMMHPTVKRIFPASLHPFWVRLVLQPLHSLARATDQPRGQEAMLARMISSSMKVTFWLDSFLVKEEN
eukprot:gnl/Dysnectes_brevis/3792_a4876_686.p1 GENE.gnl/Dysnectes_brevis/3792_a4876_686~~gnl/Dysnectes_brevis/3792_a4876_686.p1  ORF type:complete len:1188 (-),score=342.82 gnl/Dysnectes_brevis/3792_a4876_686:209-3451(-)